MSTQSIAPARYGKRKSVAQIGVSATKGFSATKSYGGF
jgi:hypothetical protein